MGTLNETDLFFSALGLKHAVVIAEEPLFHDLSKALSQVPSVDHSKMEKYRPASLLMSSFPVVFQQSTSYVVFDGEKCEHIAGGAPFDLYNYCGYSHLWSTHRCISKAHPPNVTETAWPTMSS